ncbi:hypothetical protein EXS72_00365 [Candidatus Pacearchaeota archaeon]|nr:hypothetical protein [Candidatus Pacearchaeota archaeon]
MDSSDNLIRERREKVLNFVKAKASWIVYIFLALIVWLAVWIRTRNLPGLRDVTTGGWTLGPDLDPFLFLRYAKYIVEHGSLFAIDTMRYVPANIDTNSGFPLHYYFMAWFHKVAVFFGSVSVEQSSAIYPVFLFALTAIAFFFLAKKILICKLKESYASIGALTSTIFLSTFSVFIPRTIAGIPEKESAAFLFMFLAIYFFICSWNNDNFRKRIIYGIMAGFSTAIMALIWGAYAYLFFIIVPAVFLSFLMGNTMIKHVWSYGVWFISAATIMISSSPKYPILTTFTSLDRGIALMVLGAMVFYHGIYYQKIQNKISKSYSLPPRILSSIMCIAGLIIIGTLILGPKFMFERFNGVYSGFVRPATSRLIQTVAENRQPYLTEWISNFGPNIRGIFVTFWMFLFGALLFFWQTCQKLEKKDKLMVIGAYIFMIFMIIFTRYSGSSLLNGENNISLILYAGGILLFIGTFAKVYFRAKESDTMNSFNIEFLLLFIFLFISLISARGFIRLVMIVVPPASIFIGYLFGISTHNILSKTKTINLQLLISFILIILILFSVFNLAKDSTSLAKSYVPSVYTQQWQKAMSWVRENTPQNSVFGHWWDYGYWIQSIGDRATVLDGGNDISYWNHLMGRYALTESDFSKTLEFLYAHNTTHFLIDSTDIGKYGAFSSIGSDETLDRRSWIPSFVKDSSQKQQRKNSTLEVYISGALLDEDIIYNQNGTEIFLPSGKAVIGAILIESQKDGTILELNGYFVNGDKTYILPLKHYYNSVGQKKEFNQGINAGVFVYPRIEIQSNGQANIDREGVLLYLSPRTINTNLVNYYLLNKKNSNFILEHVESDMIIEALRMQNMEIGEFTYLNEFRGPIKIWALNYPKNILLEEKYLEMTYPDSIRLA